MCISSLRKYTVAMILCALMLCSTFAQAAFVLPAGLTEIDEDAFLNDQ